MVLRHGLSLHNIIFLGKNKTPHAGHESLFISSVRRTGNSGSQGAG